MYPFTFPLTVGGFSSLNTFFRVYCCGFSEMVILIDVRWYLFGQLICLSLRISDAKHRFMCIMAISTPSLEKVHRDPWLILYWSVCILILLCGSCLYVVETNSPWYLHLQEFFPFWGLSFFSHCKCPLLCKCFKCLLDSICLFCFIYPDSKRWIKKELAAFMSVCVLLFSLRVSLYLCIYLGS